MSDDTTTSTAAHAEASDDGHAHDEIHLPPNSWAPISLAGALTVFFVGFLVGPVMWILGAFWTAATLAGWYWAARREFMELPD